MSAFEFEVTRYPLLFTAAVDKFRTVFLKTCHGIKSELIVGSDELGGAWHDHWTQGFVAAVEVLYVAIRYCHKVCFEVFRVRDEHVRADDADQRLGGEVACLFLREVL